MYKDKVIISASCYRAELCLDALTVCLLCLHCEQIKMVKNSCMLAI